ncbi:MAG: hypothetical protein ACLUKH_21400 [Flavonifractor plautii]
MAYAVVIAKARRGETMILDRAINGPRASMETRTLSQEELGRFSRICS